MTPRSEAIAYRIWAYANPRGWNCTCGEIADELRVSPHSVGTIVKLKGWIGRVRESEARIGCHDINTVYQSGMISGFDDL